MKQIILDQVDGHILLNILDEAGGTIGSTLHEVCPFCGCAKCYHSCDESVSEFVERDSIDQSESEEEVSDRRAWNTGIDMMEAIILAHACAGIDVSSKVYQESIQVALDALSNDIQ